MHSFRRIFAPPSEGITIYASMSTMSKEGECSLARGHGEIGVSKDTMVIYTKPNLEVEITCVCNLKELLNLKLKITNVDVLALSEKKTTAQVDLVATQSKVIVVECMLEKTNHKFKKFGVS